MILVTGATGHVGNVLVRKLSSEGAPIRALVLPRDDCASLRGLQVEKVEGNVLDPDSLDRAMEDVEMVYHLAGIIAIMPGAEEIMRRVNVEGVRNVVAAARKAGIKRLVHVSSIHAFQRLQDGEFTDETTPLALTNAAGSYDQTKAEGTLAVREGIMQGLDAVVVHPTAIIGPYDYLGSELGKAILSFARRHIQLLVRGAYDFVDVRDIVEGLILAGEKGRSGEAYILSGTYTTIPQLKQLAQRIAGIRTPQLVLPNRLALAFAHLMQHVYRLSGATPQFTPYSLRTLYENARFSSRKAREELGFRTRPLTDTVRDLLAWRPSATPAHLQVGLLTPTEA